jgi:hypothetical protein
MTLNNGRRGPNRWRDQLLPEDILNDWIKGKNIPEAQWTSTDGSLVDGNTRDLKQNGKQ